MLFDGLLIEHQCRPQAVAAADTSGTIVYRNLFLSSLLGSGTATGALSFLCVGLALMGLTYGPLGTALAELFPTAIRYTGASLTFNLAGIVGASLTPYIATYLGNSYGLPYVGYYLSGAGIVTLIALIWIRARNALAR